MLRTGGQDIEKTITKRFWLIGSDIINMLKKADKDFSELCENATEITVDVDTSSEEKVTIDTTTPLWVTVITKTVEK